MGVFDWFSGKGKQDNKPKPVSPRTSDIECPKCHAKMLDEPGLLKCFSCGTPIRERKNAGALPPSDAAALQIRKHIQDNLDILKFLCTCGTFNLDKCRAYMAMSAQQGKPFDTAATRQLENANQMIGGYERLRTGTLIPEHMKAWGTFFKLLADMRPDSSTVQFLVEAQRQFDAIGAQLKTATPGQPDAAPDTKEEEYVRRCLTMGFSERPEQRRYESIPEAQRVLAPLNSGRNQEALQEAENIIKQYGDWDVGYLWATSAMLELREHERARNLLQEGLENAKRKSRICALMGNIQWKTKNLRDAIYWWVQAIHCQEAIKDYEESPYLYLHYVADALGLSDVAAALIERVDRIRYSIRLNATTAADLGDLARQQTTPGMRDVLVGLCGRYLKPSPPPTDLSEAEVGLERALHQIESALKNHPNPAFSLVSLGLQTTQYGKKIVWRFKTGGFDAPGTMDDWAAANFLNQKLKPIGVTVSGSDMVDSARGNQFFEYDFRTMRTQPAVDPREIGRFIDHAGIVDVAVFLSDGKRAVSFGRERSVKAWDLKTFAESHVISNRHLRGMLGVRPDANGVLLVYQELFAKPSVVRQWDLDSGNLSDVCQLNTQTIGGLRNAVFSANCRVMLVVGDKKIVLWSLSGPTLTSQFEITKRINALALSANAQSILCAEDDNLIHLVNATSGQRTATLVGHEGEVNEVRFTPSGDLALSCSNDRTVRVWDLHNGKEVRCLRGHTSGIWCLDVSADGNYAASAGSGYPENEKDCTIRIWDINTGSEVARYVGHSKGIRSVRFNRSGDLLMSASVDKTVRLWKLQ